jgi:hypothetical protein
MAHAKPRRGTVAPARSASHKSAIRALLLERGSTGVLGSELYDSPGKFGRSPRNRIAELRKEGCLISGKPHGSADWHYVLLRDADGTGPVPKSPEEQRLSEYMTRMEREKRRGCAAVRQTDSEVLLMAGRIKAVAGVEK